MSRDIEIYTENYNSHRFEEVQVRYRKRKILEILNKYKPKKILEIGCGNDSIFNSYKEYEAVSVVEPSHAFYLKALEDFSKDEKVSLYNSFLEELPRETIGDFDFIIFSGLLHEVEVPEDMLKNVSRFCSKNTVVHINVPNSRSFHLLLAYSAGLIDSLGALTPTARKFQQNTTFDMDSLEEMVKKFGFMVLDKGSFFLKMFNHAKMQQCLENGVIDDNVLDGLYRMVEYMPEFGSEIFVNIIKS
ncbi:MAG: class I SAM-dependent methyltransferase [Holosporaceae bacterium]|jgi:ubiquinone/menaquinone biosynthesis C-methylase UbiE|nr:class I SAM-dependent methyltransferase [Holosporaceae bacterium]